MTKLLQKLLHLIPERNYIQTKCTPFCRLADCGANSLWCLLLTVRAAVAAANLNFRLSRWMGIVLCIGRSCNLNLHLGDAIISHDLCAALRLWRLLALLRGALATLDRRRICCSV